MTTANDKNYSFLYYIEALDELILWPNNHLEKMELWNYVTSEFYDAEYIGDL